MVQARTADGTVVFEGPVVPTGPAVVDDAADAPARAVFEMPPGRLRLRMSVQDAGATVLDQDVREMSIRDLKGDVAVSTPEILRARTVREFKTLEDEAAVPVASREFSRTEHLLIRFHAYGSEAKPPAASARLLDRAGHAMRVLPVTLTPAGDYIIDLPLAMFAPGDYAIEVKAASGGHEASERTAIRITY